MNKEEFRQRAAIQVLPQCISACQDVLLRGGALAEPTMAKQAAKMAVQYADALTDELFV